MGCGSGTVKCILNTINIFWGIISVLILLGAGLSIGSAPSFIIYLLFITGGVGLIGSILGCCGICQENVCMTIAYASLILATLILQVCCLVFSSKIEGVRKYADDDVNKYWDLEVKEKGAMDFLQETFECCGKNTPNDYLVINRPFPDSCYPHQHVNSTTLYTTGCITKTEEGYVSVVNNLVSGSYGTIIFNVIILLFAIYLIMRFRRKQRNYNY